MASASRRPASASGGASSSATAAASAPAQLPATALKIIFVSHAGVSRPLALVPDLPVSEMNAIIQAQFALDTNVVALVSARRDAVYPLSLLAKNPMGLTSGATYPLLLQGGTVAPATVPEEEEYHTAADAADGDDADGDADGGDGDDSAPVGGEDDGDTDDEDDAAADEAEYHAMVDRKLSDASEAEAEALSGAGYASRAVASTAAGPKATPLRQTASGPSRVAMIEFIQKHTAFARLPMTEIFHVFSRAAQESESGTLDRKTFERCFGELLTADDETRDDADADASAGPSASDQEIMAVIASRIFDVFDRDGNGTVDYSEFIAGISLLCRASSDDKIKAAFSLFDLDNDGFITVSEMTRYLTSFFDVCFALDSGMRERFANTTPAELGAATAAHCFKRADTNADGSISYDEFKAWYAADDSDIARAI